jgi:uncharacterized membrane protein YfcA
MKINKSKITNYFIIFMIAIFFGIILGLRYSNSLSNDKFIKAIILFVIYLGLIYISENIDILDNLFNKKNKR